MFYKFWVVGSRGCEVGKVIKARVSLIIDDHPGGYHPDTRKRGTDLNLPRLRTWLLEKLRVIKLALCEYAYVLPREGSLEG